MEENTDSREGTESFLFHHLLAMFQALALQQLGKIINPATGKVERDLQQARITIDMIEMIQTKTAGNLSSDEMKMVESILMDLRMNYVDESSRKEEKKFEDDEEGKAEEAAGADGTDGQAGPDEEKSDEPG